ncbi:putative serine/threonine protein phosphatase [Peltigera leucophlebia]|nr:putative serine/threonine protein phosphatase [Peltigera leucophlebia]
MKFLHVALPVFLSIASEALAAPNPAAAAETEAFCSRPGQPCHKLKRVAAALAEPGASAEADAGGRPWCWLQGQGCAKNKRDAGPAPGGHPWCWMPGQACSKAKRQLEELEAAFKTI